MDFSNNKLVTLIRQKMAYESERQSVIARNIANSDTPGYKPQDLKKVDFKDMVDAQNNSAHLVTTNPKHISSGASSGGHRFEVADQETSFETKPNGNAVSIDEQMMKMSENNMDYQTTTTIYRKMLDLMRIAVGGGK